jgi:hypothetical protein
MGALRVCASVDPKSLKALRMIKALKAHIMTLHSAKLDVYHPTFEYDAVFEMEVRSK